MKKIRVTESELVNLIKNVVMEQTKEKITGQTGPLVNRPKMESMEMNEAGQPCPPPTVGIRPNCVVITKEGPYPVNIRPY